MGSRKECHMIAERHKFSDAKDLGEVQTGSHPMRAPNVGEVG